MQESNFYIKGILNSDVKVLKKIYADFFPKTLRFVINNKGQYEDAEDVFQKALLQISARIHLKMLTTIHTSFEAYIFTACKNLWRKELLRKKRSKVTNIRITELASDDMVITQNILEEDRWQLFSDKLQQLSENCRKVLQLFFKKTPYEDIVKQMSYSSKTVARQRVFKCKAQLIKAIQSDDRYKDLRDERE